MANINLDEKSSGMFTRVGVGFLSESSSSTNSKPLSQQFAHSRIQHQVNFQYFSSIKDELRCLIGT